MIFKEEKSWLIIKILQMLRKIRSEKIFPWSRKNQSSSTEALEKILPTENRMQASKRSSLHQRWQDAMNSSELSKMDMILSFEKEESNSHEEKDKELQSPEQS